MKWWQKPLGKDDKTNPWYALPNSVDVEMTAYGLLTYLQRGLVQDALPIMKWLIAQRNEQGGFASTQVNTYHMIDDIGDITKSKKIVAENSF
jgi:CD109 antigen